MRALALTLETIAGCSATEGKVQSAAAYLASQAETKVGTAARFLAGAPLPRGTPATAVGHSTLVELVSAFTGEDRRDLLHLATKRGDLGIAVAEVLEQRPQHVGAKLELSEVAAALNSFGTMASGRRTRCLYDLFERATPLEAKYLTKLLLGSLRTGVQVTRVEEAIAVAFDQPISAVRRAYMLLGDVGKVAERAFNDTLSDVKLRAFQPLRMMLAAGSQSAEDVLHTLGVPLIGEDKYDGIRAQAHIAEGRVQLFSRTLEDTSHFFPEVRRVPPGLTGEWILDGEVLAWVDGRALSFARLQRRLGRKQVPLTLLLDSPVIFLAFDVLLAASEPLIDTPLERRKRALDKLPDEGPIRRAPWALLSELSQVQRWYDDAMARGNEGAVFKATDSLYRPGTRGRAWVKLKRPLGTIDVVVTGAEYGQGKNAGLLSDLIFAVRGADGLVDSGRACSGLRDTEIAELTRELRASMVGTEGPVQRVHPRVILEVAFGDIQSSTRHPSGFALRFPRIVRRRTDLTIDEISSLDDLRDLHDQTDN